MKRRSFITAFGTAAMGSGMALGTGAFNATSSNSDSAMSLVTEEQSANLNVVPGNAVSSISDTDVGEDVVLTPDTSLEEFNSDDTIAFENLSIGDLPLAIVNNPGTGMVNIQVAVAPGTPSEDIDFSNIIAVVNNSDREYEVGFTYTSYGGIVGSNPGDIVPQTTVNDIFSFKDSSGTKISPDGSNGESPANQTNITSGGNEVVDLIVDTDKTVLTDEYGNVWDDEYEGAGDFGTSGATNEPLITEVTAVADEV